MGFLTPTKFLAETRGEHMVEHMHALLPILALLLQTAPSPPGNAVVGFTIVKPSGVPAELLTLPGSVRRLSLRCKSGCSEVNMAQWKVEKTTGAASATLTPSPSGNYVDVAIGHTGASCPITGAGSKLQISAAASVTITATSKDNPSHSDSLTLDVCSPKVEAYTIPFYRVLFSGQREDVQGVIWGSANTEGTWSILAQPSGGDAALDDRTNRDTVFHASVKGLYKIAWTSSADPARSAYSTFYVTGNTSALAVQPNGTEPVDCTVDPNAGGPTLEVGPTQKYKNLEAINPGSTAAGTTIRLHNEDTTGKNPTTYHEWIQITNAGTHDRPIRLCGVPDANGALPVIDGANATARADILDPAYLPGYAGIMVYSKTYDRYPHYSGPQFILVEGVSIRNFGPPNTYHLAGNANDSGRYIPGASGFRFQKCRDCELNGSEISANGNGVFAESNDASAWGGVSMRLLFEGNNVHDNGVTRDDHEHNWYVQAWFQVFQFNQTPSYNPRAEGSMFKDRGISWFRYNLVGVGALRVLDLVENQDATHYMDPAQYLTGLRSSDDRDAYTGDQLAAALEAWHSSEFVYGNIFEGMTGQSIHFWADNAGGYTARTGTLEFYNNTIDVTPATPSYRAYLFDTGDNGSNYPHLEWPILNIQNIVAGGFSSSSKPYFFWNTQRAAFLNFGKTLLSPSWGSNARNCTDNETGECDGSGWPFQSNSDTYAHGNGFNVTGTANFVPAGARFPWEPSTYALKKHVAGLPLTGNQATLPVRFQYLPVGKYAIPRHTVVTATTGGEIGAVD